MDPHTGDIIATEYTRGDIFTVQRINVQKGSMTKVGTIKHISYSTCECSNIMFTCKVIYTLTLAHKF